MATIHSFEEIESWKKARDICKQIGVYVRMGRFQRNYGLIHQIEKSSGSVMDNIAEGFERGSKGEFITFLGYAKGSCGELRSQLYRAADLGYISEQEFTLLKKEAVLISSLLQKFITYLGKTDIPGNRRRYQAEKP